MPLESQSPNWKSKEMLVIDSICRKKEWFSGKKKFEVKKIYITGKIGKL